MTDQQGRLLLAGGYAAPDQEGIHAFRFDEERGALTRVGGASGLAKPSFLVVNAAGDRIYAVSEMAGFSDGTRGAVCALRFSRDPFEAELLGAQPSGGDHPCHLALDPTGRWLVVSNYSSGCIGVLPIREDGSLGELADHIQHQGSGPMPDRQDGPHAHSATFSPDGRFVIVADLGIDQLIVYALDGATGRLAAHSYVETRPGSGPRHVAFHPNGERLYVANELDSTVDVYAYDAGGALFEMQTHSTLPADDLHKQVADIHIDSAGKRLYVSNRGHDSIAVFDVQADGSLARLAIVPCGGSWPRNFALAPGGKHILVANQHSDELSVLPLLADTQAIGEQVLARERVVGASVVQFVS
jgi:6-phosphogluconolactonase